MILHTPRTAERYPAAPDSDQLSFIIEGIFSRCS
jgi:hypothetical protein